MSKTIIQVMGMRSNKFGGLERFTVAVCRKLKDEGYKSVLIYEEMPASPEYLNRLRDCGVQIEVIPARGRRIVGFFFSFAGVLVRERPEVIHAHFDPVGYAAILLSALFLVKSRIRSFHSLLSSDACQRGSLARIPFKTKFLKRMQYLLATQIFAVSGGVKSEYERMFRPERQKIEVLYMGVNPNRHDKEASRRKYNLPADKIIITCTAFHDRVKGVDVLLDALKIVVDDYGQTNFLLCQVGAGKDTELLKKRADEHGISGYVQWMGLQNNVPEILAASDIYVQPSRSEGISMALMEASMAGLPLVGSDVGGIPEVVVQGITGMLTEAGNPPDLADELHQLLADTKLRNRLGCEARKNAMRHFNIENQSGRMIEKYLNK